jgi:hypothetical protein
VSSIKQTESAALGKPSYRQHRWIVSICALLGAGIGFALSFQPFAMDGFEYHAVSGVYEDEQGRTHVELFGAASIWVAGVKMFSEESPKWDWDLSDRWRRHCQLIAGGLAVVGFVAGAGLGLGVQRLTQRRPHPVVIGCLSFAGCFVLGFITTAVVRDYALRDLPRAEVQEALYHDRLAVQWSCVGWLLSFAVSLLVAAATSWWARASRAEPSAAPDSARLSGSRDV